MDRRNFLRASSLFGLGMGLGTNSFAFNTGKPAEKRIGMIGLDTSHCIEFVKAMNAKDAGQAFDGYTITIAYPHGSRDIESSYSRIEGYTKTVKEFGVKIAASIDEVIANSDVIMLETNDGKLHLEQALPVFKAGKRVFIDKPIAAKYEDVVAIFKASRQYNTPFFSASSLRYVENLAAIRNGSLIGKVHGADTYSPSVLEPSHSDFYWYGIHGVEMLFTAMGTGCTSVNRINTPNMDVVVGTWNDGRLGSFRGTRQGKHKYGGIAFGETGNMIISEYSGYKPLLLEIVKFFNTGIVPVDINETLEIYAFMEAADESKKQRTPIELKPYLDMVK